MLGLESEEYGVDEGLDVQAASRCRANHDHSKSLLIDLKFLEGVSRMLNTNSRALEASQSVFCSFRNL